MDNQSTTKNSFEKELASNPQLYFNREELGEAFQLARSTVRKMIEGIEPAGVRDRGLVWKVSDVSTLQDQRQKQQQKIIESHVETNPDKMKPSDRRTHYQAEDLKQASLLKERRNMVESGELIYASKVEHVLAHAFKTVALTIETLPDVLNRDGLLDSADIERTIALIDDLRTKLATDLRNLSVDS